jgi:predicted nuclease with RNAse H fold
VVPRPYPREVLTIGVDLAAEPARTARAAVEWAEGRAVVRAVALDSSDADIVELSRGARAVGIDCAFGWPLEFAAFVQAHTQREVAPRALAGRDWRRRLAYRETDRAAREATGRWPLSVSTDRLGMTAMRCAELLEAFDTDGEEVDRSGGGRLVEVYPAAALRHWRIDTTGYKTRPEAVPAAVAALRRAAPWLEGPTDAFALMARSNDALDAVVAALNARAHALGATLPIPPEHREAARAEGWIALPTGALEDLV